MEAAMEYLAETDDTFAEAKTHVLYCEILCKRVRARVFIVEAGIVDAHKCAAEGHKDVIEADEGLCQATEHFEKLKAKRQRAEILIDVYRTLEASRRKT